MLSILFSGMNKSDQSAIARRYGLPSFEVMESWIRAVNVTRNNCAHHGRLWNRPSVIQPKWPAAAAVPHLAHLAGNTHSQTRFYGTAAIVRYLLRSINPNTTWSTRLKSLCADFPASPVLTLDSAGFPANWEAEPLWN